MSERPMSKITQCLLIRRKTNVNSNAAARVGRVSMTFRNEKSDEHDSFALAASNIHDSEIVG